MFAEGWLEGEGVRLHYVEWQPAGGPRDPGMLLLHGLSANALYWSRLAERLPGRRLVALDQRSHGLSDRPPAGADAYASHLLVEDAARAIASRGLERPVVVGHSWGAGVALELAATRPEAVSGLGFVDGPAAPISERLSWDDAARLMQPPLPRFERRQDAAEHVRPWLQDAWAEDLQAYAEASTMAEGDTWVLTLTAPVRLELLEAMYAAQPQLLWAQLELPSLVALAGADSAVLPWKRQGAELIASLVPTAQVRWYDSAHDIPLIRPAQLAADLENLCLCAAWRALGDQAQELQGDWKRPAARELLAHLASSVSSLARVLAEPAGPGRPVASKPFDRDRWNASQLRRRQDQTPADLRAELATGTAALEAAISAADLTAPAAVGRYAGQPLGEVIEAMLEHQRGHLAELRAALTA